MYISQTTEYCEKNTEKKCCRQSRPNQVSVHQVKLAVNNTTRNILNKAQ